MRSVGHPLESVLVHSMDALYGVCFLWRSMNLFTVFFLGGGHGWNLHCGATHK